jgi:predicted RNA-binding Zn-ribbon protein involved in translation (DUF1610 family)
MALKCPHCGDTEFNAFATHSQLWRVSVGSDRQVEWVQELDDPSGGLQEDPADVYCRSCDRDIAVASLI